MALYYVACLFSEHNAVLQNRLPDGKAKCVVPTGDAEVHLCVKTHSLTPGDLSKTVSVRYRKGQRFVASFSSNLFAHAYLGCIASACGQEITLAVF